MLSRAQSRSWKIFALANPLKSAHTLSHPRSFALVCDQRGASKALPKRPRDLIFGETGRGFSGWSKARVALDKRIAEQTKKKVAEWRLHDLRRTVATRMADIGVLPHVIEAVLNHISGHKAGVAGVYNRSQYGPERRQALDQWGAHVEALAAGKRSNVVAMKA